MILKASTTWEIITVQFLYPILHYLIFYQTESIKTEVSETTSVFVHILEMVFLSSFMDWNIYS